MIDPIDKYMRECRNTPEYEKHTLRDLWHYPAKGELPDKDVECLVCTKSGNKLIAMIDSSDNCWCTGAFFSEYLSDNCVACWQYIVPPEEEA